MNNKRKAEIRGLAREILDKLELSCPVDLDRAVNGLGGEVLCTDILEVDGRIIKTSNESFRIEIKDSQPEVRKRFSVAHELGHLFIHMGYKIDDELWERTKQHEEVFNRKGYSEEEYEANEFAAELLMPEKEFRKFINTHKKEGKININSLMKHFNVSEEAALNRGKWLGIFKWN